MLGGVAAIAFHFAIAYGLFALTAVLVFAEERTERKTAAWSVSCCCSSGSCCSSAARSSRRWGEESKPDLAADQRPARTIVCEVRCDGAPDFRTKTSQRDQRLKIGAKILIFAAVRRTRRGACMDGPARRGQGQARRDPPDGAQGQSAAFTFLGSAHRPAPRSRSPWRRRPAGPGRRASIRGRAGLGGASADCWYLAGREGTGKKNCSGGEQFFWPLPPALSQWGRGSRQACEVHGHPPGLVSGQQLGLADRLFVGRK
jgi:hypothetical protein